MRKHHPKNERIKRRYLAYLSDAKRLSSSSADRRPQRDVQSFNAVEGLRRIPHRTGAQLRREPDCLPNKCRYRKAARPRDDPFATNGA